MWRKFKRWICVSCKVPACIFNYSFCANQSFIHRPVWSIWDTRQDCSVNPLSLSYRRSYLWGQGFSTSNFWLLKDQRFERANICPICSNISNTNSDTCFQTKFQSNFIWNYSPFIGLLSPDHPSLSLLLSLSLCHLAKLTFTFLLFKTLCSVALAYLKSFFSKTESDAQLPNVMLSVCSCPRLSLWRDFQLSLRAPDFNTELVRSSC